uniref:Uncharacterized protein n=2 Tax=viral metagenome TaxID=1070528 RepID=A0A6M3K891_9ZZZZ
MDVNITRPNNLWQYVPGKTEGSYVSGDFFSTISGTPSIASNKLRINTAEVESLASFFGGSLELLINVPVEPTAGDVRAWGFKIDNDGNEGRVEFDITDTDFTANLYDASGTVVASKTIDWDATWTAAEARYRISAAERNYIFAVNDTIVARFEYGRNNDITEDKILSRKPVSIHIQNGNADNMDVGLVSVYGGSVAGGGGGSEIGGVISEIQGNVAHDAVDAGNPVKIGAKASATEPSAVSGNDRVNIGADLYGNLKAVGNIAHDTVDRGDPVKIGGKASSSKPTAVSSGDRVNAYFDTFGRQHIYDEAGGGVGAGLTLYVFDSVNSMGQGQTAYTAATQVTVSGLSFTPNPRVLVKIEHYTSAGAFVAAYTPQQYTITYAAGVYTVTGAAFGATDLIVVYQQGPERTTNLSTNAQAVGEVNQINYQAVEESLQDTTNVAAATNYYPSALGAAMMGSKGLSLSGKFIDADGTMTLDVEVTNDEDATNADWISAGLSSIDQKTGIQTIAAALTVTNGTLTYAIKFPDLNFRFWRAKMVNDGATNTSIIKARRIAN